MSSDSSIKRKEDASLLRGRGTFVDNLTLPGTVYMAVVRSPYPRARITGVDLDAAQTGEGVVAAFSGADLAEEWAGGAAVCVAGDRGHQDASALPARDRRGAIPG